MSLLDISDIRNKFSSVTSGSRYFCLSVSLGNLLLSQILYNPNAVETGLLVIVHRNLIQ